MSDNIPFEIQVEIMKRLPVKSLIQFRSVSKQWKSLIDGSEFIANYHRTQQQQQHLLVSYADPEYKSERKYVSIVDDDTFPHQKFPLTVPVSIKQLHMPTIVNTTPIILGSSQGLFCFYNFHRLYKPISNIAVILNPAIRKSVDVVVPNVADCNPYYTHTVLGFGVCPHTNDPKLVKVFTLHSYYDPVNDFPWEVEVFTLSSGVWRSPKSSNLPSSMTRLSKDNVVIIDGFIYWHAYDMSMVDGNNGLLVSFDLTSEEFTKIYLPDSLAISEIGADLSISKLRNSLVVLQSSYEQNFILNCVVWMMENGDPTSFTKIFTITPPPDASITEVLGFRKSGEAMIEVIEEEHDALYVYEHDSEQTNYIGIPGRHFTFYASCYMETLLLLDH